MMRGFLLHAVGSDQPLAEFRTDGQNIDFIVDNSGGKIGSMCSNDFNILNSQLANSHHLDLCEQDMSQISFANYPLANGDNLEISSDGKTVRLNGRMLPENDRQNLKTMLENGTIQLAPLEPVMP